MKRTLSDEENAIHAVRGERPQVRFRRARTWPDLAGVFSMCGLAPVLPIERAGESGGEQQGAAISRTQRH
eukprot:2602152-Prymnesium_polylepis.1